MTLRVRQLSSLLNVHPGEGRLVGGLTAVAFCLGLTRLLVQTASGTLFLLTFTVRDLPYVYVSVAVVVPLIGAAYAQLESRLSPSQLLQVNLVGQLAGLAALWLSLASARTGWAVFTLAIWVEVILAMSGIAVWGLAGRLLNLRQGKRLFGLISMGDVAAATLGSVLTPGLVERFGILSLVVGAMVGLIGARMLVAQLARQYRPAPAAAVEAETERVRPADTSSRRRRYTRLLLAMSLLSYVTYYFIDNIFYGQVEVRYPQEVELASFLGLFGAVGSGLMLLHSLFLVGPLITRFGVRIALLSIPVSTLATAAILVVTGLWLDAPSATFWLAMLNAMFAWVFGDTLYRSALSLLYQPIPPARRLQTQTTVESVGQSIGQGIAGVELLGLSAAGLGVLGLNAVLIGLLVIYLAITIWVSRDYVSMLVQALAKRWLEGRQLLIIDHDGLRLLRQRLTDPHPGTVLYALTLLEEAGDAALVDDLQRALAHPVPEIRQEVLARLERLRLADAAEAVRQRVQVESEPGVCGAALRALAALDEARALERLSLSLNDAEPLVRAGALTGLWRYGGTACKALAVEHLNRLARSVDASDRALAAHVAGETGDRQLEELLVGLLADSDTGVRRAALISAGRLNLSVGWPAVVAALSVPSTQDAAASALVAGGESSLPALQAALASPEYSHKLHVRVVRVLGRMGGTGAIALLRAQLLSPDGALRHQTLLALRRCQYRAAGPEEMAELHQLIDIEVADAVRSLMGLSALDGDQADAIGLTLLRTALNEVLARQRQSLLLALAGLYDSGVILRVRDSLTQPDKHAYGLEVLDNLIAASLRSRVLPVLDDLSPAQCLRKLGAVPTDTQRSRVECLHHIASSPETDYPLWVRACVHYALAHEAGIADAHKAEAAAGGIPAMLALVEKVIILKSVGIFAETPHGTLAEIAAVLQEVRLFPGERLFAKNAPGRSMYIIVSGRVRVHDDEVFLNTLGERDIVGEMAVLDASPRMASVTAVDETHLLRLDQEALYELMADHPVVAQAIIRVLTHHLRARVNDVARLSARLHEFEKTAS